MARKEGIATTSKDHHFYVFNFDDREKGPTRCHIVNSLAGNVVVVVFQTLNQYGCHYLIHNLDEGMCG